MKKTILILFMFSCFLGFCQEKENFKKSRTLNKELSFSKEYMGSKYIFQVFDEKVVKEELNDIYSFLEKHSLFFTVEGEINVEKKKIDLQFNSIKTMNFSNGQLYVKSKTGHLLILLDIRSYSYSLIRN